MKYTIVILSLFMIQLVSASQELCSIRHNKIEGNIYSLSNDDLHTLRRSLMDTKILVNYGQYVTYPKEDGSFEVDKLPSDSYVLEVVHPKYIYDPVRVDITSKGKIRARRVNYIQPSFVQQVNYPLSMKPISMHRYFTPRETWRFMDILMNPMVLTMVAPLVLFWLLPKMMNSAEAQDQLRRETIQQGAQMPEFNVPELSEMMTNMFRPGNGNGPRGNQPSHQALSGPSRNSPAGPSGSSKQTRRR